MFLNILDEDRKRILKELNDFSFIKDFYLAGGTGLSLMMGLRESFDFDFFSNNKFSSQYIYNELKNYYKDRIKIINVNDYETCDIMIDSIKVSFFGYHYKTIGDFYLSKEFVNIKIASIEDIACMKLSAIGGRGSKKDFFDLYNILIKEKVSTKDLIKFYIDKYGISSMNYIIMGLTYFEDAKIEVLPKTFVEYDFKKIQKFFIKLSKDFLDEMKLY